MKWFIISDDDLFMPLWISSKLLSSFYFIFYLCIENVVIKAVSIMNSHWITNNFLDIFSNCSEPAPYSVLINLNLTLSMDPLNLF